MDENKRKYSTLDVNQIQKAMFSEEAEAMRVEVVSGFVPDIKVDFSEVVNAIKEQPAQIKSEIQIVEVPKIITQTEIKEIQVQTVVKEFEIREIEKVIVETKVEQINVPQIIVQTEIKEIEKLIYIPEVKEIEKTIFIPQIKIIEIEKPVIIKEFEVQIKEIETTPKYIPILFIIQTLAILALLAHMFKRG